MKNQILIERLDSGLNLKNAVTHLDPSESPELKSVSFDAAGAVETAKGMEAIHDCLGGSPIQGLSTFTDASGSTHMVAAWNGSLYEKHGHSVLSPIPDASSIYGSNTSVFMTPYKDKLFISDGVGDNYKYNGNVFSKWGISAPTGVITAAEDGTGVLSGIYTYAILAENEYLTRGDYGPTTQVTVTDKQVLLSNIPVWDSIEDVKLKYVCRSHADTSGLLYIVGSMDPSGTTYSDNTLDTSLTEEAPIDNGVAPKLIAHATIKGIMVGIAKDDSNMYFSNLEDPEVWSSEDYVKISNGDGLVCTGLSILADAVLVSKNKVGGAGCLYYLYMPSSDDINWSLQRVDSWVGGQATKAMVPFSNSVMMINRFGVWDVSQSSPGMIRPDPISFNIEPIITNLSYSAIERSAAVSWNNKLYISAPYGTESTFNNMLLVYDFVKDRSNTSRQDGAWSYSPNVYLNDFTVFNNNLYAGDAVSGVIYQMDTGYNNDGKAIVSSYKTAPIFGSKGEEGYTKVWRSVWLLVSRVGDWPLHLSAYVDFQTDINQNILIDLNPSGCWDQGRYDEAYFDVLPSYDWVDSDLANYTDTKDFSLRKSSRWDSAIFDDEDRWDIDESLKWIRWDLRNAVGKYISIKWQTDDVDNYFKVHKCRLEYFPLHKQR